MSRFGTVTGGTANALTFVAQGADVESLLASVQKVLFAGLLTSGLQFPIITSITLAGAGDGHQFFIEFEFASAINVIGGVGTNDLRLLMDSTAEGLQKQIAAMQSQSSIVDVQIAGASQGRLVMALVLFGQVFGTQNDFLSRFDLSVNDAYVEGPYSQSPVLHAHSGGNVAGGFNGAGVGSKAYLGFNVGDGLPLAQLKSFQYTWRDLSPGTSVVTPPFTDAYVNFVVDMDGLGGQYNIFVIDPQFDASLVNNTTVVNPDGTSTTTFDAATQCPVIITPPSVAPVVPAHTFLGNNSYKISDVLASFPNAVLRAADTGDGGSPKSPIKTAPVMIITGDSTNNVVRAFQVKNVLFNGALI